MFFNQVAMNIKRHPSAVKLSEIMDGLIAVQVTGPQDAEISGVTTDSRAVKDRWMFVATEGEHVDGHEYVQRAIEQGASCVVVQMEQYQERLREILTPAYSQHNLTTVIVVHDSREALGVLAGNFYGSPARQLRMIGITGTNGKTTSAFLIKAALEAAGEKTGLIGTIEYAIGDKHVPANFTTPLAEQLHAILAEMLEAGCSSVVMEVSSHALALNRVYNIDFDYSLFTNLTQDHLDFHQTMDAYSHAKELLFSKHTKKLGLINTDDPAAALMGARLGRKRKSFGKKGHPAFAIREVREDHHGLTVTVRHRGEEYVLKSRLAGSFNAYNLAGAFAVGVSIGLDPATVIRGLRSVRSVPGRFERILSADGVLAIVDYSHTPDSLQKAIETARELSAGKGRVITVFGCGGDRDRLKRPLMGRAASQLSDLAVITSDNPRGEDPQQIIADIEAGVDNGNTTVRVDRRSAINFALRYAKAGDIVLVAGKGHETYQTIGTKKRHFDDREIVRAYFEKHRGGVKS